MSKRIYSLCITFIVLGFLQSAQAQLKKLNLIIDPKPVPLECLYSNIIFIDDRPESEKKKLTIDEDVFSDQLNTYICKDITFEKNLLVQLRKLYHKSDDFDYNGKYEIQMSIYEKGNDRDSICYWIGTLSQSMKQGPKNNQDQKTLSNLIVDFVNNSLDSIPQNHDNWLVDLDDVVAFEKEQIKLYQTDQYTNGVYCSFSSFANQIPDFRISSYRFKDSVLKEVKYNNPKSNKEQKVKKSDNYAVVIDGYPFLLTENSFIPLYKDEDNNLCVTIEKNRETSVGYGLGLIGALMPYEVINETSEVMIDHLNGELSLKSKKVEKSTHHIFSNKPFSKKEKEIIGDGSNKKQW